jgi:hypothetical protein
MSHPLKKPDFRDVVGDELAARIAAITESPGLDDAVARAERERAETDRLTRHTQLCDAVVYVLRGGLGKSKEAATCIEALKRTLAGVEVRKAETATLVFCESIIREAKERIRKARRPPPAGRGAT